MSTIFYGELKIISMNKNQRKCLSVVILLVVSCLVLNNGIAQNQQAVKRQKLRITVTDTSASTPLWIKMMDSPNPNYAAAIKSFDEYWMDKKKPTTEEELFKNAEHPEDAVKNSTYAQKEEDEEEENEAKSAAIKYSFEYKKFLIWQKEVAPYVQEDGSILSADQRIKAWSQQKQQIQLQKAYINKDGKK